MIQIESEAGKWEQLNSGLNSTMVWFKLQKKKGKNNANPKSQFHYGMIQIYWEGFLFTNRKE